MSVQSNRNIWDHLLGVNFFSNSFPLLAHKVPSHGKTQYMLGTRQVLACLRCQFFWRKGRNLEDARGERSRRLPLLFACFPRAACISGTLASSERSGALSVIKFGYLCMREILVCMGISFEISLRNRTETLATHASVR